VQGQNFAWSMLFNLAIFRNWLEMVFQAAKQLCMVDAFQPCHFSKLVGNGFPGGEAALHGRCFSTLPFFQTGWKWFSRRRSSFASSMQSFDQRCFGEKIFQKSFRAQKEDDDLELTLERLCLLSSFKRTVELTASRKGHTGHLPQKSSYR
jgi:hypothetical protein